MSIDACIKKVTYCHIIYGKTVETANEIANLCLAYQDQGHTDFLLDLDRSNHELLFFKPCFRMENISNKLISI